MSEDSHAVFVATAAREIILECFLFGDPLFQSEHIAILLTLLERRNAFGERKGNAVDELQYLLQRRVKSRKVQITNVEKGQVGSSRSGTNKVCSSVRLSFRIGLKDGLEVHQKLW